MAEDHGAVASLAAGRRPLWLVSGPAAAREVLGAGPGVFAPTAALGEVPFAGAGRFLPSVAAGRWGADPRVTPEPARLRAWFQAGLTAALEEARSLGEAERLDLHEWTGKLARCALTRTALGAGCDPEQVLRVGAAFDASTEGVRRELERSGVVPAWVPTPARARLRRLIESLDAVLLELVRARRDEARYGDDLLGWLFAASDRAGTGLTDTCIRDTLLTFWAALREPLGLVAAFSFHLLALRRDVAERIGTEDPGWTRAVVREAARLYPPLWVVAREALADTSLAGWNVARGTHLWISPWVLHRDPSLYEEASTFRPERWLAADAPGEVFPTGGGRADAACLEMATELVQRLRTRLRFEPLPTPLVELVPTFALRPKEGIWVQVARRVEEDVHAVRRVRAHRRAAPTVAETVAG